MIVEIDLDIENTTITAIETDNKVSALFKSFYEIEGNQLIVYNIEFYSQEKYPILRPRGFH
jgi:hypothetical protein